MEKALGVIAGILAVGALFWFLWLNVDAANRCAKIHQDATEELNWVVQKNTVPLAQQISILIARRQLEAAGEEKRRIAQNKQF